jgi:ankyrin repeat protein
MRVFPWFGLLFLIVVTSAGAQVNDTPLPTDDPKVRALYKACTDGDLIEVKNQVGSGAPIDGQVGTMKSTPLMEAVYTGHLDIVKYLVDYRAKIDQPDSEGSTALLHACWRDYPDIALALIDAGANVNLASKYGRTPLMFAADKGDDRIVQALLDHKAAVDADCGQGPAVHWAASTNHLSTVKLLVAAGANPNLMPATPDRALYSTLGCAAANDNLEMIDYLLSQKTDVNNPGADGVTPLMSAIDYGRLDAVNRLLESGANVELKNSKGMTALMVAGRDGETKCVSALLDHGADPNAADPQGETALTIAGERGNVDIVDLLKAKGAKRTDVHVIPRPQLFDPLPPAPAWAVAVSAIYALRGGSDPKVLGGGEAPAVCKRMLQRDWRITDNASLQKELDDLRDKGHHAYYQSEGAKFAQMSDSEFTDFITEHPERAVEVKAMRASYIKWKDRSGLAWDLCRSANIVNAGYAAKYLTAREAWDRLMAIARTTQSSFASWQEMSDNFLDAREIWAKERNPRFDAVAKVLLNPNDPNSPWNQNPWKTDLSGNW